MAPSSPVAKGIFEWCLAIFPLVISIVVGVIAYRQFKMNKQKFRLDLYNRRFAVYEKTIEYYQAHHADNLETIDSCSKEFIRRYREALFLFGKSSEVYKLLTEFKDAMAYINEYKKTPLDDPEHAELRIGLKGVLTKLRNPDYIIEDIEKSLLPWLDFKDIEK